MPITANPTAVGFWSPTDKGKTTITWSTGNPLVLAKVFRSVDGASATQFDGGANGASGNTKGDPNLSLGHTYTYDLRRTRDNAVIATVTVSTYDVQENLLGAFVQNGVWDVSIPPQEIINLTIAPGIDFVRISFQTTQPTIPSITCSATDGSSTAWFPLFGGMRTKHTCILGESPPLPQDTIHSYKITAAGHKLNGTPEENIVTGTFRTGSRHATIMFDKMKVRNDSDSLSNGELTLAFGGGDADTGAVMGVPLDWPYMDISDDDPPVDLNLAIPIAKAPRRLWAQVAAFDDDYGFRPGAGVPIVGESVWFDGGGSRGGSNVERDWADVTGVFDIADIIAPTTFPIELATDDFRLAYTVFGRITVDAFVPAAFTMREPSRPPLFLTRESVAFSDLGKMLLVSGGGGDKHSHSVGLGADGAIYHKLVSSERRSPRHEGWTRLGEAVGAPVKAVARKDGGLSLFAFDGERGVLYQNLNEGGLAGSWRKLGGRFDEPPAVAEGKGGKLDIFGLGADGTVYHAQLGPEDGKVRRPDWQPIGGGVAGSLSAFAIPDGSVGVFALGRDGQVLHKLRSRGKWTPGGDEWQGLGTPGGEQLLVVRPVEEKGVGLATLAEDRMLRYLAWPDYPSGKPARRWKDGGTIDAWLAAQAPRARGAERRASVKSNGAKATRASLALMARGIGPTASAAAGGPRRRGGRRRGG